MHPFSLDAKKFMKSTIAKPLYMFDRRLIFSLDIKQSKEGNLPKVSTDIFLKLRVQISPSFTKPFGTHNLYQGGSADLPPPPCYLKNSCPVNLKFFRVLETSFNVLEMLKMFT